MYKIITDHHPSQDDIKTVRTGIIDFNDLVLGYKSNTFSVFLKDPNDTIQGGILAWMDTESIYIEILWVDAKLRGQGYGSKILRTAEDEGRKNGCIYCTLDTFGFQAEEFYLKNGYYQIGEIKNYIRDYSRIFLRKNLHSENESVNKTIQKA